MSSDSHWWDSMVRQEIDEMVRELRALGITVRVTATLSFTPKKLGENFLSEGEGDAKGEPTSCAQQAEAVKSDG